MAKVSCVEGFSDWTIFEKARGQIKKQSLNGAWKLGRALPISSLGRYVFGSEISYNKPPPRLPGLAY